MDQDGAVRLYDRKKAAIAIPQGIADAITGGATSKVYACLLPREGSSNPQGSSADPQSYQLIATSLPPESWGRLIRITFTVSSRPGSLEFLDDFLQRIWLFERVSEERQGVPHCDVELIQHVTRILEVPDICPDGKFCFEGEKLEITVENGQKISSTPPLCNLRVAGLQDREEPDTNEGMDQKGWSEDLKKFHDAIFRLLEEKEPEKVGQLENKAIKKLTELVDIYRKSQNGDKNNLPTVLVNALSRLEVLTHSRRCKKGERAFGARELVLESGGGQGGYVLSLESWRDTLDDSLRQDFSKAWHPGPSHLAAVLSAVKTEHVFMANFIRLDRDALVDFDFVAPSRGQEHVWRAWMRREVRLAGGDVQLSYSRGRFRGRWSKTRVIATFQFTEDDAAKGFAPDWKRIKRIVDMVRNLKGEAMKTIDLQDGKDQNAEHNSQLRYENLLEAMTGNNKCQYRRVLAELCLKDNEQVELSLERAAITDCVLSRVTMLYIWPRGEFTPYIHKWWVNPYGFTLPIGLEDYKRFYGDSGGRESQNERIAIVERIKKDLDSQLNRGVVVVGGYRCGKTSVLRMLRELLESSEKEEEERESRAVDEVPEKPGCHRTSVGGHEEWSDVVLSVNAGVVPPHALFFALARDLKERETTKGLTGAARDLYEAIKGRGFIRDLRDELSLLLPGGSIPSKGSATARLLGIQERVIGYSAQILQGILDGDALESISCDLDFLGAESRSQLIQLQFKLVGRALQVAQESLAKRTPAGQEKRRRISWCGLNLPDVPTVKQSGAQHGSSPAGAGVAKRLRLIVLIDELADSSEWHQAWAFPAWREAIESPSFGNVRWVMSTVSPLSEATHYSPLGNVLREYNLGPLTRRESSRLIRYLEDKRRKDDPPNGERMAFPTITPGAERYLMFVCGRQPYFLQVSLWYIYEEMIFRHIPVIREEIVRMVIARSVMLELSDFFANRWRQLSEKDRESLLSEVRKLPSMFSYASDALPTEGMELGPSLLKRLERAGLAHADLRTRLVPLFAEWLTSKGAPGGAFDELENSAAVPAWKERWWRETESDWS